MGEKRRQRDGRGQQIGSVAKPSIKRVQNLVVDYGGVSPSVRGVD
jgi:hypothetical protein